MSNEPLPNQLHLIESFPLCDDGQRRRRRTRRPRLSKRDATPHTVSTNAIQGADAGRDAGDGVHLADRCKSSNALLGNVERSSWFVDDDAWEFPTFTYSDP